MGKILTRDRNSPPQDPTNPLAGVQSQESFTLTPEILAHPIFECAEDPILSTIIESLKCLARPEVDNFGLQTQNKIFSTCLHETLSVARNDPDMFANLRRIDQTNATICQKMIAPNGFFFRCLDCENTEDALTISAQCHQCFEEARHEGHRIVKVVSGGAVYICDCGRLESIKAEGFCPRHKHKEQTVEEALVDFPTMLRYKFTDAVKKTIYGIVSLLEIKQKSTNKKSKTVINLLAATYFEGLIHFYMHLTGRISRSFTLVLEKVLKLNFDEPLGLVWHDCTDMKDETHIKKIPLEQPNQCSCTLLGCIMRFSKDLPEQIQIELCKILVECFKEKESIDYLHRQIIKHSYFIFGNPGTPGRPGKKNNSRLCQMLPKVLSLQESELEYIDYMLELLGTIIEDCSIINNYKCTAVQTIKTGIALFLNAKTKASDKALQETGLMKKLLELLSRFQVISFYKGEIKLGIFEHTVEYTNLSDRLGVEALLCMSLDCGLKRLGDLAEDKRDPFFKEFAKAWYENFQGKKPIIDHHRLFKRRINPHSGMEKVLCLMIIHYLQEDISKNSLDGFFRKFFPDVYPSILASNAVKETLVTLGLMRFTDILRTVDTHTKYNYHLPTYLYEMDVVLIQLMTLFIRPEDLFSLFTRSFFSYSQEIIDICLSFTVPQAIHDHPHSRHIILALEDFLEFFVYMMNDEICLMNLNLRDKLSRIRPGFPPERVIRKLFVNILHEGRWINVGFIKDIASMFMCENAHAPVDSVISKLVLRDDQTHMIKLKREYNSEVDPYIFYKHYHSSRSNRNFLAREETLSRGIDVVSGIFYTDLPEYLTAIQHNIFQSQLPDFVCHLINNFCKEISRLLQPALRLVLFNLQVVNESLKSPNSSTEQLQKTVEANYLNNTFVNSLNKILGQSDYKDCEPCIRKIQGFIKDLSSKLTFTEPSMNQDLTEQIEEVKMDPVDEKKRQAKLKMEKLKEEFAKKQTRFAEKNESFLTQINVSPDPKRSNNDSNDSKGRVCQYCLVQIDDSSSEEYGVPIFIEFTNNFYDADEQTNPFLPEQYHDLSKTNWWPVISSCNHFYHRKCFDLHVQSSRGPQNLSSQFFMNDCEVQCALCRKL